MDLCSVMIHAACCEQHFHPEILFTVWTSVNTPSHEDILMPGLGLKSDIAGVKWSFQLMLRDHIALGISFEHDCLTIAVGDVVPRDAVVTVTECVGRHPVIIVVSTACYNGR